MSNAKPPVLSSPGQQSGAAATGAQASISTAALPRESQIQSRQLVAATHQDNDGCCTACHEPLLPGAKFCAECGQVVGCPCPHCGADVGPGGDFCEACGQWCRSDHCHFCDAVLVAGASFCTECGNSQQGLRCVRCRTQGFFDFCGGCGEALSDQAQQMLQAPQQNEALSQALQHLRDLGARPVVNPQVSPVGVTTQARPGLNLDAALQSLRAGAALDAEAAQRSREAAAQARQEAWEQAKQARALEVQARQAAQAQMRHQAEMAGSEAGAFGLSVQLQLARERVQALLAASRQHTFPDAQTARRHFMQLRSQLVREGQVPRKWLCNWANCEHDNPNDCGNPSLGGVWLFD